jgi:hypothetical protein
MMNEKVSARNWSWPTRGTIPEFARGLRKTIKNSRRIGND